MKNLVTNCRMDILMFVIFVISPVASIGADYDLERDETKRARDSFVVDPARHNFPQKQKLGLEDKELDISLCCDRNGKNCKKVDLLAICVGPNLIKWECQGTVGDLGECKPSPIGGDD